MKRMIAAGFVAALATVGLAGTASAAPADAACFGQVHKDVNTMDAAAAFGAYNVGELVQTLGADMKAKGKVKNEAATTLFC